MLGRVMKFQACQQAPGLFGCKSLIERCSAVSIQIVHHQMHFARLWIVFIQKPSHLPSPIPARFSFGHSHASPTAERLKHHEDGRYAIALVERIETLGLARLSRQRLDEPHEFSRRLYAEALRRGLNQARKVYVVADGGVWIWNIVADRFGASTGVLDFYHASEHLWAVARAIHTDEEQARRWAAPLLHQLKHGGEGRVLKRLTDLVKRRGGGADSTGALIETEANYFARHRDHLHYQAVESEGCPKGSGAIESTCSQLQDRFKRTGQFWTLPGEQCLLALELARRNEDWDEIWELAA